MREKVEEGRSREVLLGEMSTLLIYAFWTATAPPFCPSLVGHCTGEATAEEATGNHGKKGRTEFGRGNLGLGIKMMSVPRGEKRKTLFESTAGVIS